MITKRNNTLLLGIVLLFSNCLWINAQECNNNTGMCVEIDTLSTSLVRIELPCGYKKRIYNYDEGKFIDYYYKDGSTITLFRGALQKTPLLANDQYYTVNTTDTLGNKIVTKGTMDDKVWREDSFEGIRACYEKVSVDKMNLFDNVLDSLSVLKVKQ